MDVISRLATEIIAWYSQKKHYSEEMKTRVNQGLEVEAYFFLLVKGLPEDEAAKEAHQEAKED